MSSTLPIKIMVNINNPTATLSYKGRYINGMFTSNNTYFKNIYEALMNKTYRLKPTYELSIFAEIASMYKITYTVKECILYIYRDIIEKLLKQNRIVELKSIAGLIANILDGRIANNTEWYYYLYPSEEEDLYKKAYCSICEEELDFSSPSKKRRVTNKHLKKEIKAFLKTNPPQVASKKIDELISKIYSELDANPEDKKYLPMLFHHRPNHPYKGLSLLEFPNV